MEVGASHHPASPITVQLMQHQHFAHCLVRHGLSPPLALFFSRSRSQELSGSDNDAALSTSFVFGERGLATCPLPISAKQSGQLKRWRGDIKPPRPRVKQKKKLRKGMEAGWTSRPRQESSLAFHTGTPISIFLSHQFSCPAQAQEWDFLLLFCKNSKSSPTIKGTIQFTSQYSNRG